MGYLWRRTGAFVIDLSIISMFIRILYVVIAPFVTLTFTNAIEDLFKILIYLYFCVMVSACYNVICYKYFKYPLGKLLMSIKVLGDNEQRVSNKDYFIREFNKYIYIYATLGFYIPFEFIFKVARKKQTFHDKQAQTHVGF